MKQVKAILLAAIFIFTSSGFGAGTETNGKTGTTKSPSAASITDSSSGASKENKMGQILNIAVGGMNFAVGANFAKQCGPHNGYACAMAGLHFLMGAQNMMQASAQGKSGGQAMGTVYATDIGLDGSGYDPDAANLLGNDPEIKAGKEFAAAVGRGEAGFTYDPKTNTLTTAKGNKIKGSDLNSSSAMEAAGVPKGLIDALNASAKDVEARAMKKVGKLGLNTNIAGEEGSSGGGGGSGGSSADSASGAYAGYGAGGSGAKLGIDRDPAQVAGMQKNYNGEPIGVAGDSIFKMMTRRYKVKESQSTFLDESDVLVQK